MWESVQQGRIISACPILSTGVMESDAGVSFCRDQVQSAFRKELPLLTKKRREQQVLCSWQLSYLASLVVCICADGSYP
jgi:hypothetical protein